MQRILTSELAHHVGGRVRIAGHVHRVRALKTVAFLIVRDRAGLAQAVVDPATLGPLTAETPVAVEGTVAAAPTAPGGVELHHPEVRELSAPAVPLPFDLHRPVLAASLPAQLDHAAVSLRHPERVAALRTAAAATAAFRSALDARGFVEVCTPKIVGSATESGANVFALDYFGTPAYLAQSPQFYKQTLVGALERVYEVGPVFRAEPHDTGRHLAQYTSLDVELGFVRDHTDVLAVLREVLAAMMAAVGGPAVPAQIPAVHFTEALRIAGAPADEPDLAPAHERAVGEWAGGDFVVVTGYPMAKRPFYTHPDPARPAYSNSFDLLFRGVELVTGGQRLHRHADYLAALAARGESPVPYAAYLDAFRYGMPPHGGFAIGLERLVARLLGLGNVRQAAAFPRDRRRLTP
jgi:nondiscriminating aspartyl-tRNA synthetase